MFGAMQCTLYYNFVFHQVQTTGLEALIQYNDVDHNWASGKAAWQLCRKIGCEHVLQVLYDVK